MENARIFCQGGIQYLAAWNPQRFEVYGNVVFDCLQSVRNLYSDVQIVLPTPTGDLIVVASRQVVYYSLITTKRRDRLWQKFASEPLDFHVLKAQHCPKAAILVLLSANQIVGMGVQLKSENGLPCGAQLTTEWVVRVKQELFEMTISSDEKYLALRSEEGKLLLWNLENLPQLIHKTTTLEKFVESNQVVSCDEPVLRLQFRKQEGEGLPNSLYILTQKFLRIYQDVKLEDAPSSFVQLLELQLSGAKTLLQIERQLPKQSTDEQKEDYRRESVDTIIIHCDNEYCVYELYKLRSARANCSSKLVKRLNLQGIDQLYQITHKSGDKHLSLIGRRQGNLCRLLYMYFEDQVLESKYFGWATPLTGILADDESSKLVLRNQQGNLFVLQRDMGWLKGRDLLQEQPQPLEQIVKDRLVLYQNCLYWVADSKLHILNLQTNAKIELPFHKPSLREMYALCCNSGVAYLLCDGEVVRVADGTAAVVKSLLPFNRVLKLQYNSHNRTLLVKNPKWYTLYRLDINSSEEQFELTELRKSSRHLIYGGSYWVELYESEVVFGMDSNKVVSFSIPQFLGAISKQHDVKVLFYRIYHVTDDVFQLQIQNYVFFLHVQFDTKRQKHVVAAVRRNKHTVELLMARVGRLAKPESLEVVLADRDLTIRTNDRVVYFGRYMGEVAPRPELLSQSNQLNFSIMRNPVPMHHPKFLNQLLQLANFSQVETILWIVHGQIIKRGAVDEQFRLDLSDFLRILNQDKYAQLQIAERYSQLVDFTECGRTAQLKQLSQLILEDNARTNLHKNNPLMLASVIDFCVFRQDNARSMDFFSSIFISQTRHLWMNKGQCLSTKELCWILHSNNKEQAFQLLIEQPLRQKEEQLTWAMLSKYAAVLWYQNLQHTRKWLQRVALAEYKRIQDPFDCLLWYVLLGKKNIVMALFKKAMDQIKTYEFLQRDFSQQQHRTAASKNAYALLSKKRYEHAVAFFILAGSFQDALSVCMNQLKDIQLAILICKLFEAEMTKKPLESIYRQNFLATGEITGDVWIRHCGFYLLGQHVASYNCLFEQHYDESKVTYQASKISCESWRQEFQPELSVFHPSVMILADHIKDSFKIKRELQEYEESKQGRSNSQDIFQTKEEEEQVVEQPPVKEKYLQPNPKLHLLKSVKYYLMINVPYLALTMMLQHPQQAQQQPQLFQLCCEKYVNQIFASAVTHQNLEKSIQRLEDLKKLTEGVRKQNFQEYFSQKLQLVDCGELMLPWYLKLGNLAKVEEYLGKYLFEVRQLLLQDATPFAVETRSWYLTGLHFVYWLQETLKLLQPELLSSHPRISRLHGQLFVCLQMCKILLLLRVNSSKGLNEYLKSFIMACDRMNKNEPLAADDASQHLTLKDLEDLQLLAPQRKHRLQTSKTSKRMDILEEAFRRQINDEKEQASPVEPQHLTKLVFHFVTLGSLTQRTTIQPWMREILIKSQEHVKAKLEALLEESQLEEILSELRDVLKNGAFFWGKTKHLNSDQTTDRQDLIERLTIIDSDRFISNRLLSSLGKQLRDSRRNTKEVVEAKQLIFRNGIELFRNKAELARLFAVNCSDSPQYGQAVILFKKSIKKIDLYAAVATRNRSQDGSTLLDEDVLYTVPAEGQKNEVRSPVLSQCLSLLSSEVDRKVQLVHSYRKLETHSSQYLRQQEQRAYTDFNQLNSVVAHRTLPLFMIGAKASVDVLAFSTMKSLAKLQCPGLAEIVRIKMDSAGDFIGCCDSEGNFSSYRFDNGYTAAPNFLLKKTNVSQFSYLHSNLVATTSNKQSLLHVYDPLIAPSKSCIYKDRVSNSVGIEYVPESRKLLVIKKSEVNIFDIRRGFLSRFDTTFSATGGENRCSALTNSSHRLILGNAQGELRIVNLEGEEMVSLKPFKFSKKSAAVQDIRVSRSNIFALSTDGALSYSYSMD